MAEERRPYRDPKDVDPELWEELLRMDRGTAAQNAGALLTHRGYLLRFLDTDYEILPEERLIEPPDGLGFEFYMVVLNYLIRADAGGLTGRTVTEKELKGGQFFFVGPHELKTKIIIDRFGTDPEGFIAAGQRLGGVATGMGDASIRLMVLPRVPLGFILWRGDEEFGASVATTFDSSIERLLPLDCVWSLVTQAAYRLARA